MIAAHAWRTRERPAGAPALVPCMSFVRKAVASTLAMRSINRGAPSALVPCRVSGVGHMPCISLLLRSSSSSCSSLNCARPLVDFLRSRALCSRAAASQTSAGRAAARQRSMRPLLIRLARIDLRRLLITKTCFQVCIFGQDLSHLVAIIPSVDILICNDEMDPGV